MGRIANLLAMLALIVSGTVGARSDSSQTRQKSGQHPSPTVPLKPLDPAQPERAVVGSPVNVMVIVTDRDGTPVANLSARDFEVRDDGAVQPIDAVSYQGGRDASGRLFAFFLDEYHVHGGPESTRVREGLARFVTSELRPEDVVVVMKPLDPLTSIHATPDRDEIRRLVTSFDGRKGDYAPRTTYESTYMSRSPETLDGERAQIVLSGLRALALGLGGIRDGRKALVFVSEGFVRTRSPEHEPTGGFRSLAQAANHFDVGVYPINPHPDPDDSGASQALREIANDTGGTTDVSTTDVFASLQRLERQLNSQYRLTYRPSRADDGQPHRVEVRVRREAFHVQARTLYVAPVNEAVKEAQLRAIEERAHPKLQRPNHQSVFIRSWLGVSRGSGDRTRVVVTWEPTDRVVGTPVRANAREVILIARTPDGAELFHGRIAPARNESLTGQTPLMAVFEALPGRVEIEMTIEGVNQKVIDSDVQHFDVPNLMAAKTVITQPEVLRTRTEREFKAVSVNAEAPPVVSREFDHAERLLIRVPAYGPGGTAVRVTAKLQNLLGQTLAEIPSIPCPRPGVTQFDLALAPFAPGEYQIEFTAAGQTGPLKAQLRFRLTG
jgi:VWFA-related protein